MKNAKLSRYFDGSMEKNRKKEATNNKINRLVEKEKKKREREREGEGIREKISTASEL